MPGRSERVRLVRLETVTGVQGPPVQMPTVSQHIVPYTYKDCQTSGYHGQSVGRPQQPATFNFATSRTKSSKSGEKCRDFLAPWLTASMARMKKEVVKDLKFLCGILAVAKI